MGCFVENVLDEDIDALHMEDGDVAVITRASNCSLIGSVVQRYGIAMIAIGEYYGKGRSTFFRRHCASRSDFRVRLLQPGTTIKLNKQQKKLYNYDYEGEQNLDSVEITDDEMKEEE